MPIPIEAPSVPNPITQVSSQVTKAATQAVTRSMSQPIYYNPPPNANVNISTKKPPRDPGAPKRNMSAYLLYQNAMREQFKAQNPGMTFGQLAKYTSAMYAEMPPAEKQAWVARAEADKQRYLHQLANYVPPPGYDAKGDAIMATLSRRGSKRGSGVRDENAPKRNMSAYLLYQNAMRDTFKRENPGLTFGQLAQYTSRMYKTLTPEEKATWDGRAAQDKARYDAQMANYVPPPGHDARGNLVQQYRATGKRQKRAPKDPLAPKRARGSFVFFTFEVRPLIMKEYPGIKFVEMGTILGERWRALTPEQKKKFEIQAAEDKIRFSVEMQRYTENIHQAGLNTAASQLRHHPAAMPNSTVAAALHPNATVANALHHHVAAPPLQQPIHMPTTNATVAAALQHHVVSPPQVQVQHHINTVANVATGQIQASTNQVVGVSEEVDQDLVAGHVHHPVPPSSNNLVLNSYQQHAVPPTINEYSTSTIPQALAGTATQNPSTEEYDLSAYQHHQYQEYHA